MIVASLTRSVATAENERQLIEGAYLENLIHPLYSNIILVPFRNWAIAKIENTVAILTRRDFGAEARFAHQTVSSKMSRSAALTLCRSLSPIAMSLTLHNSGAITFNAFAASAN